MLNAVRLCALREEGTPFHEFPGVWQRSRIESSAMKMRHAAVPVLLLALAASVATLLAQSKPGVISGPVGSSPYDIVRY